MSAPYRVLVMHNAYQHRGGEDSVVASEVELLRSRGHAVETYLRHNDEIGGIAPAILAQQTLWSRRSVRELTALIRRFQPDIMHAHNTFPLVSPSLYWAASRQGVPVVQTLHNFRLMCLNALFLREGRVCEDCLGQLPWRGVVRACYRDSRLASGVLAGMLTLHRGMGTYRHQVTRYIALNRFCRDKFIAGGLPARRLAVKPNFVEAPAPAEGERAGLLFVGRLSPEKGVGTLARAMRQLPGAALRVAGDGPQRGELDGVPGVALLGSLPHQAVMDEMGRALALVVPSIWYETFGLVALEAFGSGTPVIASRMGSLTEIVRDHETGLLFEPGNPEDLALKLRWALDNPPAMQAMGRQARALYEAEFTPDVNYWQLTAIYADALRELRGHC
jgi:glycosyltransferase involved in cell wall biosynthesis